MHKLYKYPWIIITVIAVVTIFFGFQLPRAELENNNFRFVPKNDPALKTSQWIDSMFGSSLFILVGLERQYGTVFDKDFLDCIREYTEALEEIPIIKSVTSIISADYITSSNEPGMEGAIVAEKLVGSDFSGTADEIAELKRRLLSWDMYERALYSDDFTATQILIPLTISSDEAATKEVSDSFLNIRNLAYEIFKDSATVYVTGMPIIATTVNEAMDADLKLLIPVVIVVVLLILFFSFRSFTPVVLPLLTVVVTVVWTIGAMPLVGIKLSVISTVLPVILVAVGSAYGIHIITHYLNARRASDLSKEEHTELVIEVMTKMRRPVFLTAITTFTGFMSFCFTAVAPCREFGYFASFGVFAAFSITMTLIPALLILRGAKKIKSAAAVSSETSGLNTFLADNLLILARRRKTIIFFAAIVIGFSVYGLSKLIIDNAMVEYFKADTEIYRSDEFIRRQFGGSKVVSVVAEGESVDVTLRPDTLSAMDNLSTYLMQKVPNVGKVMGFTDLIKRINQIFNADESPDGLPMSSTSSSSAASGGSDFGFGAMDDDFGFGSFGFDAPAAPPVRQTPPAQTQSAPVVRERRGEKTYTLNELAHIFDNAGSSFRGMNANDLVWELKRQSNYEGASYYEIPSDPQRYGKQTPQELQRLIANYLMLLSGNISDYANDPLEPTAVKATVQLRTMGMADSHAVFREIEKYAAANFPDDVTVTIGGTTMVESSLNDLIVQSQIISMLFSVLSILIIISIANRSLAAGVIAMAPLSISILLNFAVMGLAGIKLNLGTSMVGAVAVCVGIDYTIHCLEAYKRELIAAGGSQSSAVQSGDFLRKVFLSSGKAIIINALSVGAGFAVLLLSNFVMLGDFGLLIAFTMFSSALVSLTVLPALLALIKPKFIYNNN